MTYTYHTPSDDEERRAAAGPVTNLIIAVDSSADLEYALTEHVLDDFGST